MLWSAWFYLLSIKEVMKILKEGVALELDEEVICNEYCKSQMVFCVVFKIIFVENLIFEFVYFCLNNFCLNNFFRKLFFRKLFFVNYFCLNYFWVGFNFLNSLKPLAIKALEATSHLTAIIFLVSVLVINFQVVFLVSYKPKWSDTGFPES